MFNKDMGIDLGTANTLVYVRGKGIVINEPSVVAINKLTNEICAIGSEAYAMLGRTPITLTTIRPIRNGVISDFAMTEAMLGFFITSAFKKTFLNPKPKVVICVPSQVTEVEQYAVIKAATNAGAKEHGVYVVKEPMAAAIGCGMNVTEAGGNMIVDIGGGTTEVAIVSLGGVVYSKSIRDAGDSIDRNIISAVKKKFRLVIGETTAEKIKKELGCAYIDEKTKIRDMLIRGRDMLTGLPKEVTVTTEDVHDAIVDTISAISNSVKLTLEKTPPELSQDIIQNGIYLSGGGALIKGLDTLIEKNTGIKARVADDPLTCVARGTGMIIDDPYIAGKISMVH